MICLCEPCHREIESQRGLAFALGYLVRQGEEPSCIPVLYRGRYMLLDDAGGMKEAQLA